MYRTQEIALKGKHKYELNFLSDLILLLIPINRYDSLYRYRGFAIMVIRQIYEKLLLLRTIFVLLSKRSFYYRKCLIREQLALLANARLIGFLFH